MAGHTGATAAPHEKPSDSAVVFPTGEMARNHQLNISWMSILTWSLISVSLSPFKPLRSLRGGTSLPTSSHPLLLVARMSRIDTGLCFRGSRMIQGSQSQGHFLCQQPTFRRTKSVFGICYSSRKIGIKTSAKWFTKVYRRFFKLTLTLFFYRGIHHFLVSTSTDPQLSNHKLVDEAGTVFSLLVLRQFPWKNIQDPTSHGDSSTMFHPEKTLSMEPEKGANTWRLERKMMMPTLRAKYILQTFQGSIKQPSPRRTNHPAAGLRLDPIKRSN